MAWAARSFLLTLLLFQRVGRRLHSSPDVVLPIISYPSQSGTYRNLQKEESQFLCVHAQSLQSCPTLCSPMDCSPPGSSVHGISQARILEWVAMPSSRDPRIEPKSPASPVLQADSLPLSHKGSPKSVLKGTLMMLGNLESYLKLASLAKQF